MRTPRITALAVVFALLVLVAGGAVVLRGLWAGSTPPRSGEFRIEGLSGPVDIAWDSKGAPLISAGRFEDALAAEGFLHGLLRPLQVELRRRSAAGEIAAVAGPSQIDLDEEALASGFTEAAEREAASLSPAALKVIESYVAGLKAGLAAAMRRPPPEVRLARAAPRPWTVRDVLAFGRRFASFLIDETVFERERFEFLRSFGPADAATLWAAAYGEPFPPVSPALKEILARAGPRPPGEKPTSAGEAVELGFGASNVWAVSPSRSATGGALLAGDPHLEYELPPVWLEVRLRWPGGALAGASLAGAPGVMIGHNERVAWSFTVAYTDDADLFLVEVDDVDKPTRYREKGEWRPFTIVKRNVEVRGEKPRELVARRAGPAVYRGPSGIPGYGFLERQAVRENSGLLDAFLGLDLARSTGEAVAAARRFPGPGMNLIVADADGTIAHAVVGTFPLRRGESWDGGVPDIWSGAGSWEGHIPTDLLPLSVNPADGLVASANDPGIAEKPPSPGQRALTGDFRGDWRAARIRERLGEMGRATPEQMGRLQLDARAGSVAEYQERLRTCAVHGPAAEMYLKWNGDMSGAGAPLLHAWLQQKLTQRLQERTRLGVAGGEILARPFPALGLLRASDNNPWIADWFDDPATDWGETPCDQVRRAMDEAWQAVRTQSGDDARAWSWAPRHELVLRSPLGVGLLARWFNPRPVGLDGAGDAVLSTAWRRSPFRANAARPFRVIHGPSYRIVAAFDSTGAITSRSALAGGEDEHPASPHAFDGLGDYAAGVLTPLMPAPAAPGPTMRLLP